jgi:surface antigen
MKTLSVALVAAVALTGVTGCEVNNQTAGAVVGATTGALVGSTIGRGGGRVAATVVGGVIGAFVGSQIGAALDRRDQQMHAERAQYAAANAPPGETVEWVNPETGNRGTVRPTSRAYRGTDGRQCRNFTETVTLKDGRSETINGRRCQNADGSWEFVG